MLCPFPLQVSYFLSFPFLSTFFIFCFVILISVIFTLSLFIFPLSRTFNTSSSLTALESPCCPSFILSTLPFLSLSLSHLHPFLLHFHSDSASFSCYDLFLFHVCLYFLLCLLVVCAAALPLAGVVHARRADGAGDEVGGAGGHEVSHRRRDVHPLVCHQVIYRTKTNLSEDLKIVNFCI